MIDYSKLKVKAYYDDGKSKQLNASQFIVYPDNGYFNVVPEFTMTVGILNKKYTADFTVFGLYLVGINAEYTGEPIYVSEKFDKSYIKVKAVISDFTTNDVDINDCIILNDGTSREDYPSSTTEDRLVRKAGQNRYEIWYRDPNPGGQFADGTPIPAWRECLLDVTGKRTPVELSATYTGNKLEEYEYVPKQSVEVQCRYLTDCTNPENMKFETSKLDMTQWSFDEVPVVEESNNGVIKIKGEGLQGRAYALPTKDLRVTANNGYRSIGAYEITASIRKLYACCRSHPGLRFMVAYRNTDRRSLNGYTGYEMIRMFTDAGPIPENLWVSREWYETGLFNK